MHFLACEIKLVFDESNTLIASNNEAIFTLDVAEFCCTYFLTHSN